MTKRRKVAALAVVLGLAGVGLGACGGDDGDRAAGEETLAERSGSTSSSTATSSTTTTIAPTTTTDPLAVAEAEIRAGHDEWRRAVFEIMLEPDPNNPLINEVYAPGALRDASRAHNADSQRAGRISDFPPGDPTQWRILDVEVLSPTEAVVRECVLLGGRTLDKATGEVLNDEVVSGEGRLVWVKHEDKWKLESGEQLSEIPGVGGCATDF